MLDILSRPFRVQSLDKNTQAFLELVTAGLWEKEVQLTPYEPIDFKEIYRLAQEQSVVGLVAAGLEQVKDIHFPKEDVLTIVGDALQLEQRNNAMNNFIGVIVEKMRKAGIYTLLVKGQGVAQCYAKPQWRACGDVDLLLSPVNYNKAKVFLSPLASSIDEEDMRRKHLGMSIDSWIVELHGAFPFGISARVDKVINEAQDDVFYYGSVRTWMNGDTQVFLPLPDNDVIFIFTHFLHHFFIEGVGLRQICDWCRLLWTYKDSIDKKLLEKRLHEAGLVSEWGAFASLAVNYLGLPEDAMPLYTDSRSYKSKAKRLLRRIIKTGNMGHNNDVSYRTKQAPFIANIITFFRRFTDFFELSFVFPLDAPKFFMNYLFNRLRG